MSSPLHLRFRQDGVVQAGQRLLPTLHIALRRLKGAAAGGQPARAVQQRCRIEVNWVGWVKWVGLDRGSVVGWVQ